MFIPSYQIHNILKVFTRQLQNGQQGADAGRRLETVVNKVAGTIMSRVNDLSEKEARRRTRTGGGNHLSTPSAAERQATRFHYHTLDQDNRKCKQCLSVENSEQLINRFHSLLDGTPQDPRDSEGAG